MRYHTLDTLRGGALIGMICFHANYLLENIFHEVYFHFSDSFWFIFGRIVAITFISIAGVSFFLATNNKSSSQILHSTVKRSAILATIAILISFVTYIFFYEERISFGIIHFFILASLLGLAFLRYRYWNMPIGILIILIGYFLNDLTVDTSLLIPFGLYPENYFSADYYPIFPWFGYYLIGYGCATWLGEKRLLDRIFGGSLVGVNLIGYFGRHSLILYVIHMPIIYGLISLWIYLR